MDNTNNPINLSKVPLQDFTAKSKFYVVTPSTNKMEYVDLSDITEFLINNSELSSINEKFNNLKTTVQSFMEKMLDTYVQKEYAERDFDKDMTLQKALEAKIKTLDDLNSKLKDKASKSYVESLKEQAIKTTYETKKYLSDVGGKYAKNEVVGDGVQNTGMNIMKAYILKRSKGEQGE